MDGRPGQSCCKPQMQADSDAVMRWERQLMVSFLLQLDPEGSQHHRLQRRDVTGRSPTSSGPQILVSCPGNEVCAQVLNTSVGPQSHQKGRSHGSSLLFLPRNAQRQSVSSCAASWGHSTGKRAEVCNCISVSGPRPSFR